MRIRFVVSAAVLSTFGVAVPAAAQKRVRSPSRQAQAHTTRRVAELGATPLLSEPAPELRWHPEWERFRVGEYVATGAMGLALVTLQLTLPETDSGWWRASLSVDEGVRNFLRPGSRRARRTVAGVSDMLLYALMAYPLIVDTGFAALGKHRNVDVAAQMFAINAQAFALTSLVTMITKNVVRRERPFGRQCDGAKADSARCDDDDRYRSFISGHTSMAFTGAGLICAHNTNLDLYGDEATGRAACFTALGAATAVGAMRMIADRHYFTDVVTGAALGLLSGYFLPEWLHYNFDPDEEEPGDDRPGLSGSIAPMATRDAVGLSVSGMW